MVAYTTNKGYSLPTVAGDSNAWGTYLNQSTAILDTNMGGQAFVNVAGAVDVTATASDAQNLIQSLSGVLTGNISYLLPNVGSFYIINNATTGAFTITIKTVAGGSTGPIVPQGTQLAVYSRGGNVWPLTGGATGGTQNVFTIQGGLIVQSGGATIVGNVGITGTLTSSGALTVSSGGGAITGALTVSTAGTSGNQVTNFSQYAQVNGNPGYITLPGGYRRAFGTSSVTLASNQATINFGTTFANVRKITVSNGSAPTSQEYCTLLGNNTTQFIVHVPNQAAGAYVVSWDAEGWV